MAYEFLLPYFIFVAPYASIYRRLTQIVSSNSKRITLFNDATFKLHKLKMFMRCSIDGIAHSHTQNASLTIGFPDSGQIFRFMHVVRDKKTVVSGKPPIYNHNHTYTYTHTTLNDNILKTTLSKQYQIFYMKTNKTRY